MVRNKPGRSKTKAAVSGPIYEVEELLSVRRDTDGNVEYLVKWKGYSEENNDWLRFEELTTLTQKIAIKKFGENPCPGSDSTEDADAGTQSGRRSRSCKRKRSARNEVPTSDTSDGEDSDSRSSSAKKNQKKKKKPLTKKYKSEKCFGSETVQKRGRGRPRKEQPASQIIEVPHARVCPVLKSVSKSQREEHLFLMSTQESINLSDISSEDSIPTATIEIEDVFLDQAIFPDYDVEREKKDQSPTKSQKSESDSLQVPAQDDAISISSVETIIENNGGSSQSQDVMSSGATVVEQKIDSSQSSVMNSSGETIVEHSDLSSEDVKPSPTHHSPEKAKSPVKQPIKQPVICKPPFFRRKYEPIIIDAPHMPAVVKEEPKKLPSPLAQKQIPKESTPKPIRKPVTNSGSGDHHSTPLSFNSDRKRPIPNKPFSAFKIPKKKSDQPSAGESTDWFKKSDWKHAPVAQNWASPVVPEKAAETGTSPAVQQRPAGGSYSSLLPAFKPHQTTPARLGYKPNWAITDAGPAVSTNTESSNWGTDISNEQNTVTMDSAPAAEAAVEEDDGWN